MLNDELQTVSASPLPSDGNSSSSAADSGSVPNASAKFGDVPHASESFGKVPQPTESFRTVPNHSERLRNVPHSSARSENHTLTVREVARMFEAAGVARSERSVTNWCQPNRQGIARLDAYFDPNDRRYFITSQSVEAVITEEKAKAAKTNAEPLPQASEGFRNPVPQPAESFRTVPQSSEMPDDTPADNDWKRRMEQLQNEKRDLEIANRWKDYAIGRLEKERDGMMDKLVETSRQVGQLETKLLQLGEAPRANDFDQNELTA